MSIQDEGGFDLDPRYQISHVLDEKGIVRVRIPKEAKATIGGEGWSLSEQTPQSHGENHVCPQCHATYTRFDALIVRPTHM
jgi:Cdc14 phosphatase binding protein N-terminus